MPTYNGHPSWNAWNVALWIANDESTYREAIACWRKWDGNAEKAATDLRNSLGDRTPDGARYSQRSVRLALIGLEI